MITPDTNFANFFHQALKLKANNLHLEPNKWVLGSILNKDTADALLKDISRYILDGDEDEVLMKLNKLNNPSNICGRVFKPGEATYTCRACAVDPTCVFCRDCFLKSEHKNHKYKLHSSAGGGCCDCGDHEAWKEFPSCLLHTVDQEYDNQGDAMAKLPYRLKENGESFFQVLLQFIVEVLTIQHTDVEHLSTNLQPSSKVDKYAVVVFNDESHTFDHVISMLSRAVDCSKKHAADFATVIDREGRSTVLCESKSKCLSVKETIINPLQNTADPLKTKVMHSYIIVYQEFALVLLEWMNRIAKQSEGLRLMISQILLKQQNNQDSYITMLMLNDTMLWKVARSTYHQLLMSTCLLFTDCKREFAVKYVEAYPKLMEHFLLDDHDHNDSITSISVQLFTVPTLVHYLIVEHNWLDILMTTISGGGCVRVSGLGGRGDWLKLDSKKLRKNSRRAIFCFYDLKYTLTNVPTDLNPRIIQKFLYFFNNFALYFAALEGMNSVVMRRDRHLEREPEWETGVNLQMRLIQVLRHLFRWCSVDRSTIVACVKCVVALMNERENKTKEVKYNGRTYPCIDYDITSEPVSVHYPLTRLLSGLFTHCGALGVKFDELGLPLGVLPLAESSMRAQSLCSQVFAGAWRRNGQSLANQVFYCRAYQCRTESLDRDIQLLQACAANMDPDNFFVAFYDKMNLVDDTKLEQYQTGFTEEFVLMLIHICVERYVVGVGGVSPDEILRREVIHSLGDGAKPHSKIQKHLGDDASDNENWERILLEVADYKPSTSVNSVNRYELKLEYLDHVSPFYYHYSSRQTNVHNQVVKRRKANNMSTVFVPQPSPPFTEFFKNTILLLSCSSLLHFLSSLLRNFLPEASTRIELSDDLLEKVLFLIHFGLVEERERVKKDRTDAFNFCGNAQEHEIFSVLHTLKHQDNVAIHKDSIRRILNSVDEVKNLRSGNTEGNEVRNTENQAESATTLEKLEKWKRKKMVEGRRKELMEEMRKMQEQFNKEHCDPGEDGPMEEEVQEQGEQKKRSSSDIPVCTALSWQLAALKSTNESETCILCQDSNKDDCLVMSCLTQPSKRGVGGFPIDDLIDPLTTPGIHVTTCSHPMHLGCWRQYFDSIKDREERRLIRMRRLMGSYSTLKNEFLCPLCSRLSNCVIPSLSHESMMKLRNLSDSSTSIQDWLRTLDDYVDPPVNLPQEVVVRFQVEMETQDEEQWHDAVDSFVDTTEDIMMSQSSTVVMETEVDTTESGLDAFLSCLLKNLKDGESPDTTESWLLLWAATVTTFQSEESVMRYQGRGVMTPSSIRVTQALRNIVRCAVFSFQNDSSFLHMTREKLLKIFLGKHDRSMISMDIFAVFVLLVLSTDGLSTALKCSSITNDRSILLLCCVAQLVQVMLMVDESRIQSEVGSSTDSDIVQLFNQVRSYAGRPLVDKLSSSKLEACLLDSFRPFIRRCCLFMYHLTNVAPSKHLEESDDIVGMFSYLGLPHSILSFFDAGGTASLDPLVERWCKNPSLIVMCDEPRATYPQCTAVRSLIQLDYDYSDMIALAATFTCPRFQNKDDSLSPMMCLACGEMLCSQSYCCQKDHNGVNIGACSYHCVDCPWGDQTSGIFLRVRDCTMIMLSDNRGCFKPAPYLDEHGETDQGLRRGNPLMLDETRSRELNLIWLNHAVMESISREMEANRNLLNIDWSHL